MFALFLIIAALICTSYSFSIIKGNTFISKLRMSDSISPPTTHDVYLGNIPFEVSEDQINELIVSKTGNPDKTIKLIKDRATGKSRGFGYLKFSNRSEADEAVVALSGIEIDGRELNIGHAGDKSNKKKVVPPRDSSLFVGNIGFDVTEQQMMDLCNDLLEGVSPLRIRLATDRETGQMRGFGHIDFANADEASRAVTMLNGASLGGRDLRVDIARPRGELKPRAPRNTDLSLFLGNLSWDVTAELLEEMLDDVVGPGLVSQVRLATDRDTGRPRGFAHVDFNDEAGVEKALTELSGLEVLGRPLRVDRAQRNTSRGRANRDTSSDMDSMMDAFGTSE
mmetsp:Transcript_108695/g.306309  ORF Transcript_108695/g.306309 Transcript_108695/m.306309 type:complete len:338 (+) Transcript_108695:44-1057(+)